MTTPTDWMKKEYNDLVKSGFDWKPPVVSGPSTSRTIIDGQERIMLCANNYLSMSNHPKVKQAAIDAAMKFKYKPRVVNGEATEVSGVQNRITFQIDG